MSWYETTKDSVGEKRKDNNAGEGRKCKVKDQERKEKTIIHGKAEQGKGKDQER